MSKLECTGVIVNDEYIISVFEIFPSWYLLLLPHNSIIGSKFMNFSQKVNSFDLFEENFCEHIHKE